ncbi:MAG: hypothetical protein KAV87_05870 [Desulfobacteraceae bacterium]|nr:hypothetical protein [Desulfobacteraceae bacterium]
MQTALTGQANILELPIVAKASGNPITDGTVNFYLREKDGPNTGKWYRGADQTWQAAEAIAGAATHSADGHWYLSLPSAVWARDIRYRLYAKESGNLHIPVGEDVLGKIGDLDRILKAWAVGDWRLKSGETDVYELLDADDGSTVIVEMVLSQTTPFRTMTVKI